MIPYLMLVGVTYVVGKIANRMEFNSDLKKSLSLVLFAWVVLYSLRGITGSDTLGYWNSYKSMFINQYSLQQCIETHRDFLYQIVIYFCSQLSKGSWIFCCVIIGLLTYIPILHVIYKKSEDIAFSCLIYIFTLSYFFGFNGVRQAISGSFALMAYYCFLREKKYFGYVIWMFVAYGFHAAAVLIIPFHFLSLKKFKSITTIIPLAALFIFGLNVLDNWSYVIDFLTLFGQDKMIGDYNAMVQNATGSGLLRTIVYFTPVVLGLVLYNQLYNEYGREIDHDIMMMGLSAIFMVYSMQFWIFSTVAEYFLVSSVVYMPKLTNGLSRKTVSDYRGLILLLYFVYMIAIILHGDGGLYPYVPVWRLGGV